MASLMELKEIFRSADAVCFDVDSTVIREEGIDELAKFCGVGDAVAEMYVWLGEPTQGQAELARNGINLRP